MVASAITIIGTSGANIIFADLSGGTIGIGDTISIFAEATDTDLTAVTILVCCASSTLILFADQTAYAIGVSSAGRQATCAL